MGVAAAAVVLLPLLMELGPPKVMAFRSAVTLAFFYASRRQLPKMALVCSATGRVSSSSFVVGYLSPMDTRMAPGTMVGSTTLPARWSSSSSLVRAVRYAETPPKSSRRSAKRRTQRAEAEVRLCAANLSSKYAHRAAALRR